MKIHKDIEQQTTAWFELRRWVVSGTGLKSANWWKVAQLTKMYELIAENYIEEEDLNKFEIMERGNELENVAKLFFEEIMDKKVEEVGFITKNSRHWLSPDWIIKTWEVYWEALEIKCPRWKNYVKYLIEDKIPKEYFNQVLNYFMVMEDLETLYFMIYNPDVVNWLKEYHIITVTRKELQKDIDKAEIKLKDFRIKWEELENNLLNKQKWQK